ncbi:MAG: UDP-3-O-(3-hydroxymyristoyl)glucosamine N-acyltransferase [Phycisphaerales bacterium]|nr:UDP-3-O-(3-hydroxymyristoyl)glucosamine N-acyltransferase [Phycisphaerales bacterium]
MTETRGETSPGGLRASTGQLAALLDAELIGPADLTVHTFEPIEQATAGALTFIRSAMYAAGWARSGASAALVSRGIEVPGHDATRRALLVVPNADVAVARLLERMAPEREHPPVGVHPSAAVHPSARVSALACVGPGCVVGAESEIAEGAVLEAGACVGARCVIGAGTRLGPRVTVLDRCVVGARCVLAPGVVIGADGFGFVRGPAGIVKVPQVGGVRIGDDVEIGANSCVDRAKTGETTIGDGTKIDNLVQIAHNCRVGKRCIICGQCGLAGSVVLEDDVTLGGGVQIMDGVRVGAGASVGARSGVHRDVPAGASYLGAPAVPVREAAAQMAAIKRLPDLIKRLREREP